MLQKQSPSRFLNDYSLPVCPGSGECGRGRVGEVLEVTIRLFRLFVRQLKHNNANVQETMKHKETIFLVSFSKPTIFTRIFKEFYSILLVLKYE